MKAVKNETELNGMRACHIRDGAAMCNFFDWVERVLEGELLHMVPLNEVTVADRLELFRKEQKDFMGLSFPTISGSGPNGAVIHYHPMRDTCREVNTKELYLVDSGAQYRDGTTDITRTVHFGKPSDLERETFTRVLQGHNQLARAVFPPTTVGPTLDVLARAPLWKLGLDYRHGTGHGVGHFLNVHEGPHGIHMPSRQGSGLTTPLQPGMVVTNEPGYYHDGQFGIRIESVLVVNKAKTSHKMDGKDYLCFETITMCPIQRKLINTSLLTAEEVDWLNTYHNTVWERVSPLLEGSAKAWLKRNCLPIAPGRSDRDQCENRLC
jgi:Xaa-Pro aminopeptidase